MKIYICPFCKGDGKINWDDDDVDDCHVCNGTGKISLKSIDEYNLDDDRYKLDPDEFTIHYKDGEDVAFKLDKR